MPEGRQIARITCRCGHVAEVPAEVLRGLVGAALRAKLKCSQSGARDASVSIRWECAPWMMACRGNSSASGDCEPGRGGWKHRKLIAAC